MSDVGRNYFDTERRHLSTHFVNLTLDMVLLENQNTWRLLVEFSPHQKHRSIVVELFFLCRPWQAIDENLEIDLWPPVPKKKSENVI